MIPTKQTCTYKIAENCGIRADVYRPDDQLTRPAIVWIHGGALIGGHRADLRDSHRDAYLNAGFAIVSIDYRLAPETKLAAIIEDLQDALRWVREQGPQLFAIDPDRLGVVGHSAGGYLTLMSGFCCRGEPAGSPVPGSAGGPGGPPLREVPPADGVSVEPSRAHARDRPWTPKALVSFYGYGDIVGGWYTGPDPYYCRLPPVSEEDARASVGTTPISCVEGSNNRFRFYLYCRQNGLWCKEVAGHDPHAEPDAFAPFCPVHHVTKDYPPTLLLHGDQDTDVPYQQSVMMAEALARAGVEHELITIPGGGHGFDSSTRLGAVSPSHRGTDSPLAADAFSRALAFLLTHLT